MTDERKAAALMMRMFEALGRERARENITEGVRALVEDRGWYEDDEQLTEAIREALEDGGVAVDDLRLAREEESDD